MRFRVTHITQYYYSQPVNLCQNEARLQPRNFWRQYCHSRALDIDPAPTDKSQRVDFYGNQVNYFAIQQPHSHLTVTALNEITVFPRSNRLHLFKQMTWEQVRDLLRGSFTQEDTASYSLNSGYELIEARQFVLNSPMVAVSAELADYARASFQADRSLVETVQDVMERIYRDFAYDPSFTTIATPLSDVLKYKRGVCQDFAHLAIGCLRAFGLAARYVSGYVESLPPPGRPRLVGADASHAWFSVFIPGLGWQDYDPTNNKIPLDQHITLAWGRDFSDVTPLKGVAFGGGQHGLSVSVDVMRLD
jgi:transglutaminase-like putative cysteine protease